jgi:hypothetical protein
VRPVHDGCEHDGRLGVRRDWQHIYARNRSGRALGALSVAPGDDLPGPRCQSCLRFHQRAVPQPDAIALSVSSDFENAFGDR